jgi:hypothetical protein
MAGLLASVVNLDKPGHFIHWGVFQLSLANLLVIVSMVLVFVLALVVPFPKPHDRERVEERRS